MERDPVSQIFIFYILVCLIVGQVHKSSNSESMKEFQFSGAQVLGGGREKFKVNLEQPAYNIISEETTSGSHLITSPD
jgi:hypothetical protein